MGKPVDYFHEASDGKRYQMFKVIGVSDSCHHCAFNASGKFANGKSLTPPCEVVGTVCLVATGSSVYFKEAVGE